MWEGEKKNFESVSYSSSPLLNFSCPNFRPKKLRAFTFQMLMDFFSLVMCLKVALVPLSLNRGKQNVYAGLMSK